jgi:hypothetical protein
MPGLPPSPALSSLFSPSIRIYVIGLVAPVESVDFDLAGGKTCGASKDEGFASTCLRREAEADLLR